MWSSGQPLLAGQKSNIKHVRSKFHRASKNMICLIWSVDESMTYMPLIMHVAGTKYLFSKILYEDRDTIDNNFPTVIQFRRQFGVAGIPFPVIRSLYLFQFQRSITVVACLEFHKAQKEDTYSISQEICTRFCCALLCCGYAIVHNEFKLSFYPYSSGLLCWHWGNR